MITLKFYLRSNRLNKAGLSALYSIVNANTPVWIATGVFISRDDWHQTKQLLLSSCRTYYNIATKISNLKMKADQYLQKIEFENIDFSADAFTRAVVNGGLDEAFNPLLSELAMEYADASNFSFGRWRHYKLFGKEMQGLRPGARIKDVTHMFALSYEKYLLKLGNNKNTIGQKMKRLKTVVHFAQRKKIIPSDPLAGYRIISHRGKRTALNKAEFQILEEIVSTRNGLPARLLHTLDCFIFCCYTGLRYGDLKTLKETDISDSFIRIDMHKTGLPVSIPVIRAARKLISIQPDGHCFRVLANAVFNRFLKEIATLTGINKHLSTRVARHSFATLSIGLGIPIKVVSEILGHSSVKTTEIYISVFEETKTEEMNKWHQLTVAYKKEDAANIATG